MPQPDTSALRCIELPWLTQTDYDRLLWACDLNFVRGEDSLVRALWAGAPFVWQLYPQDDGAHAVKLQAFMDLLLQGADPALAAGLRSLAAGWNGLGVLARGLAGRERLASTGPALARHAAGAAGPGLSNCSASPRERR